MIRRLIARLTPPTVSRIGARLNLYRISQIGEK